MATVAPTALSNVFTLVKPFFKTIKAGGVANSGSPGYHTSREDLIRQGRTGDYSIQAPADKRGNPKHASGIDLTFGSVSELASCHSRLRKACEANDPRIECMREMIGSLDGKVVSGWNRVATGSGSRSKVGWHPGGFGDSSHQWHEHISVLRDRCDNVNDMRGLAEVIAGQKPGTFGWTDTDEPEEPVTYLPTYYVDPEKVDTFLWSVRNSTGEVTHKREPGFAIKTGVKVLKINGADWLLTEAGYRYHMGYLTKTKPPVIVTPPKPTAVEVTVTSNNMLKVNDTREPWKNRVADLISLYKSTKPSLLLCQETSLEQMKQVTAGLGFYWQRYGPNAVAWDPAVWALDGDTVELDLTSNRTALFVPLQRKDGERVWAGSAHLDHLGTAAASAIRKKQSEQIVAAVKKLDGPVILGGDFNSSSKRGVDGKPRTIIGGVLKGLLSEQKTVKNRSVESHHGLSKGKPSVNGVWIDEIFWREATYVSGALVDTWAKRATDHNILTAKLKI